jgi:DNA-binding NtrC family response regulator
MINKGKLRILVVDDDPHVLEALKTHLTLNQYNVETANNAKEAMQRVNQDLYHIVLSDINMPGMDGLDLLEKIKERRGESLVIMITGYSTLIKVLNSRVHGAFDYLLKPFKDLNEIDRVIDRAKAHIDRWNQVMEETKQIKR